MSKFSQFSVVLATPTVELPLQVTDGRGDKYGIFVGYKRYNEEGKKAKMKELEEIRKPLMDLFEQRAAGEEVDATLLEQTQDEVDAKVIKFLQGEITHFRNIQLMNNVDGSKGPLIKDCRTHTPDIWTQFGCSSCTIFLKEFLFEFGNYREVLTDGFFQAMRNFKASKEAETKN